MTEKKLVLLAIALGLILGIVVGGISLLVGAVTVSGFLMVVLCGIGIGLWTWAISWVTRS